MEQMHSKYAADAAANDGDNTLAGNYGRPLKAVEVGACISTRCAVAELRIAAEELIELKFLFHACCWLSRWDGVMSSCRWGTSR